MPDAVGLVEQAAATQPDVIGIGSGDKVYISLLASGACTAQAANIATLVGRGVVLTEDCP